MHPELLKSTVQACRDHIEGGDRRGPVDNVPAERLMFAVAQLADELDKLRAAGVALPHAPSEAEVRLAFEKRMLDFGWRNFDGDLRGEPKCWYYDNTDLCARWIGWREAVRAAAGVALPDGGQTV